MRLKALDVARLLIAWGTVVAFFLYGEFWLSDLGSVVRSAALFLWLIAVIAWCASAWSSEPIILPNCSASRWAH
jgi:hypothetical protein